MFALILENKVVQIEQKEFPTAPGLIWIECDDTIKTGYVYVDGVFKPNLLTDQEIFEAATIEKISQVKSAREIFQYTNLTVGNYEFTASKDAKLLFYSKVNGLASAGYPIDWRLADDISWVSLSKTEASALKNAMEVQETSAYQQESVFYIAINKATSIEELAAIDIKFV